MQANCPAIWVVRSNGSEESGRNIRNKFVIKYSSRGRNYNKLINGKVMIFRFVYFFLFGTVISIGVWERWKRWFSHFRAETMHPSFVAEQSTQHCAVDLDKWRVHVAAASIRIFTHRNDSIAYIPWYGETWAGAYRVVGTWHERIQRATGIWK